MTDERKLALIDAHVHLWDLSSHRWYPAMQEPDPDATFESLGDVTRMARDFLLPEYRAETAGFDVRGLVHVSATTAPRAYVEETAWVDDLLGPADLAVALIGAVEAGLPRAEVEADLDAQAASPRFRGARVLAGLDPASGFATDLCELLRERGLVLDLVAHPGDVAGLRPLLERFGDLEVVLEHAGWPDGTGPEERAAWENAVAALAEHDNVTCKVSGLGMVTHTLSVAELRPWIETCLQAFGPGRCLFGSNFPVEAMYGTYDELLTAYRDAAAGLAEAERDAFFAGNARRAYRL
ncbi:MAG TPA: amidohydrolase family protein [Solirubrobacterales bacterium]|nr:amidohydrolase family protein [Solirubrobacterales bacterium]